MAGYTPLIFDVTQDPDVMGVSGGLQVARSNPDCSTRSPVWKPPKVEGTHVALKTSRKSAIVVPAANPDIVPRLLNVKQAAAYVGCTVWASVNSTGRRPSLDSSQAVACSLTAHRSTDGLTAGSKSVPLCDPRPESTNPGQGQRPGTLTRRNPAPREGS